MPEHRPGCPATRTLAIGACTCGEPAHDPLCPFLVARLVCHCDTIAKVDERARVELRVETAERVAQAIEAAEATLTERTDPPGRYRTGLLRGARIAREVGRG